jgi:manganese/iron transport system permease protein
MSPILAKVLLGALLGGSGCALVGFLLVQLRVPFLAVCLSHAAMAGAVLGHLLGVPALPLAFAASMLAAAILGPLSDSSRADPNTLMAILFTAFMGLTFLGIGLTRGPKSELLSLLWGSILLVRWRDLFWMGVATFAASLAVFCFYKEFKAILFDRRLAAFSGIQAGLLFYLLLVIAGAVITVNLYAVGGLMLFSLLVNPAAAALQLGLRFSHTLFFSIGFGVVSAAAGLGVSYLLGWPAGASIVIVSSLVFVGAVLFRSLRGREV